MLVGLHEAIMYTKYYDFFCTSVVMNALSAGEARIFTAICWFPAKINPSPILLEINLCCSASESPNKVLRDLIEVVDCFNRICNEELDTIGFPYWLLMKSSIS